MKWLIFTIALILYCCTICRNKSNIYGIIDINSIKDVNYKNDSSLKYYTLDSIYEYYTIGDNAWPEFFYGNVHEVIEIATKYNRIKKLKDSATINKIDSVFKNTGLLAISINDNSKSYDPDVRVKNKIEMSITDVIEFYYTYKNTHKKIYLSYKRNLFFNNSTSFYLMYNAKNKYKCAQLFSLLNF